jgi:hypothetical protein
VEEDSSLFPQGVSHDIFLPGIKEKRIMYEQPVSKENHPMVPIYDEYESDPGES